MSFTIIRNIKHKSNTLNLAFRHNERRNTNYSNKDIDKSKGKQNYSIKACNVPYSKKVNQLRNEYHLKSQIKTTSNIACEYIITSSKEFFEEIGEAETKRYFETAYKFVANYKNLGEQYIISARVHMDESNPHMHLVYIPVVHTLDKNKNEINKISCSECWKGKNSYANLQDNYHKYLTRCGFNLERSRNVENTHLAIKDLKVITNFEEQQFLKKSSPHIEEMISSDNVAEIKEHYKKVIRKYNTLSQQYIKVKAINETNQKSLDDLNHKCSTLEHKCSKLEKTCKKLNNYIQKTFETISHLIGWSIKQLKQVVNEHIIEERQQELEEELQEELLQDNETNLIDTKERYLKN